MFPSRPKQGIYNELGKLRIPKGLALVTRANGEVVLVLSNSVQLSGKAMLFALR